MDSEQGIVIKAVSSNSASGYTYQQEINLTKTPVLQWQWSIEQAPMEQPVSDQDMAAQQAVFDDTPM